jgi:hypothetical protein
MPPRDPMGEATRRAELLTRVASGESLRAVGMSAATYSRWRRDYAAKGIDGLKPDWKNCGRKPIARLDDIEETMVKKFYVETGSVTLALRSLANSPTCSQATADAILKLRRSKHTLTRTLRCQVKDVSPAVHAFHRGPRAARRCFINPRTLTYLDPLGQEKELQVGDLSERDDMSNNFIGWIDWPWGGDACSDKYGVRIFRGQNLLQLDVRSLYFQSFCFLVRLRDSYRADDIWQWVGQSYRDMFKPALGERWERGIWKSNQLRGTPIAPGHTSQEIRLGGLQALGLRVIESQSPTTKIIENRFRYFQRVCRTIPGQIGASRGEMEREAKLWTECREGRRDPRNHFLSYEQLCDEIENKLAFVNAEQVEGTLYHGIPAEVYRSGLAARIERGDAPTALSTDETYLFSRDLRKATGSKAHAMVRYADPDGRRRAWWFHHEQLFREEGQPLAVYFDRQNAGLGATVVPIRAKKPSEEKIPTYTCELIEGMPQFALGLDMENGRGAQAMVDGLDRKKAFDDAVRSEYRALGLGSRRIARTSTVRDGAGNSAKVEDRNNSRNNLSGGVESRHATNPLTGYPPDPATRKGDAGHHAEGAMDARDRSQSRRSDRPAQFTSDADRVRRLEEQFLADNPVYEST